MTSENFFHLPQNWRVNKERLKLVGCKCPDCGNYSISMREVCPVCKSEINEHVEGIGRIVAILDHKENNTREIEVGYVKDKKFRTISVNLNGLSHSLKIEINSEIGITSRLSSKVKRVIYNVFPVTSSLSK